jgi:tRNA(fMet)-specific endonuclease VapC
MNRLYLLDTNTVSYILKGVSPAARKRLTRLGPQQIACVSAISEGELWFGLDKVAAGLARRQVLRALLDRVKVLPWGRDEAEAYGRLRARQEALGRPLGPLDTQIAAHAVAVGAILVSSDSAFKQAKGLPGLENWATDI